MGSIQNLTSETFPAVVQSDQPVLVDFWAPWCGPCRAIAPVLEDLAREFGGRAIIAKVNVDDEPALANRYGIQSIPNLLVFRNGQPVRQLIGFQNREAIASALT